LPFAHKLQAEGETLSSTEKFFPRERPSAFHPTNRETEKDRIDNTQDNANPLAYPVGETAFNNTPTMKQNAKVADHSLKQPDKR